MRFIVVIAFFAVIALAPSGVPAQMSISPQCGVSPVPPFGCRPVCACDARGACVWTFIC